MTTVTPTPDVPTNENAAPSRDSRHDPITHDNPGYLTPSHTLVWLTFANGGCFTRPQLTEITGVPDQTVKGALQVLSAKRLVVRANRNARPAIFIATKFFCGQQFDATRDKVLEYLKSCNKPQSKNDIRVATGLARASVSKAITSLVNRDLAVCTNRDLRPPVFIDMERKYEFVLHPNSGARSTVQFAIRKQPNSVFDLARFS